MHQSVAIAAWMVSSLHLMPGRQVQTHRECVVLKKERKADKVMESMSLLFLQRVLILW